MKPTDFAPRVTPFITYLKGRNLTGVEVGCDVGAHAEAILTYANVEKLYLVDRFDNPNLYWYLKGRLETKSHCRQKFEIINTDSHSACKELENEKFDFIYVDITHDYSSVRLSLIDWWALLKRGGVLGYRNYCENNIDIIKAINEFTNENNIQNKRVESYQAEIILWKQ